MPHGSQDQVKKPPSQISSQSASKAIRFISAYTERQKEALKLYTPLKHVDPFHASKSKVRLVIGSNRAGKTLSLMVELARIVTRTDPYKKLDRPNGRVLVVGKDGDHLGRVLWHKLTKPGAFWILRDPDTGAWRSVLPSPDDPRELIKFDEEAREVGWHPAPPLLPPRLIGGYENIVWEEKKSGIPRLIPLKSGWEMYWRSSKGDPMRGVDLDLVLMDEEIQNEDWVYESQARLVDRGGMFVWGVTPQDGNQALVELYGRSQDGDPDVEDFHLHIDDNPYLSKKDRLAFWRSLSEEEREVRYEGKFAITARRVYPEFSQSIHCVRDVEIKKEWTRYIIVDPGRQKAAAVFWAVTPEGEHHVYDEVLLHNADAGRLAKKIADQSVGDSFEGFLIDKRAGRQIPMGLGSPVYSFYRDAFASHGLKSTQTGSGFWYGLDDPAAREESLKSLFRRQKIFLHEDRIPQTVRQIKSQFFKRNNPDKRMGVNDDLCVCVEYGAAADFEFYKLNVDVEDPSQAAYKMYLLKEKKKKKGQPHQSISL